MPGYPSPALSPGSEYSTPATSAISTAFWSPITPPEGGVDPLSSAGFDSRLDAKATDSRVPPTLVQMQVWNIFEINFLVLKIFAYFVKIFYIK